MTGRHRLNEFFDQERFARGFLSSLFLCLLSTGYPDPRSLGNVYHSPCHTPCGPAPTVWLLSAKPGHSGPRDKLGEVICEPYKGWCLWISLPKKQTLLRLAGKITVLRVICVLRAPSASGHLTSSLSGGLPSKHSLCRVGPWPWDVLSIFLCKPQPTRICRR